MPNSTNSVFTLYTGAKIPAIGLGTWNTHPNQAGYAVTAALDAGYRHLDASGVFGNETEIGIALNLWFKNNPNVKRSNLFITSKLCDKSHTPNRVHRACAHTLAKLQLTYLDLYVMHYPRDFNSEGKEKPDAETKFGIVLETWASMEKLVKCKLVKALGVCNFDFKVLEMLRARARIPPAVVQLEITPYYQTKHFLQLFMHCSNIHFTVYGSLGSVNSCKTALLNDPTVVGIANKHNATPAQVCIAWHIQRGFSVIPQSVCPEHIVANIRPIKLDLIDRAKMYWSMDAHVQFLNQLKTVIFGQGAQIPAIGVKGLGNWQYMPTQIGNIVKLALDAGYRRLDLSGRYCNELEIGNALQSWMRANPKVKRPDLFISSKLWITTNYPGYVENSCSATLKSMQVQYLDLYVLHLVGKYGPETENSRVNGECEYNKIIDIWEDMEYLVTSRQVKAIGISNVGIRTLNRLIHECKIRPAVYQIEINPYLPTRNIQVYTKSANVHVTSYGPLGNFNVPQYNFYNHSVMVCIAKKHNVTPAQICIAWHIQRGNSVIPKSVTPEEFCTNNKVVVLDAKEMHQLNRLEYYDASGCFILKRITFLISIVSGIFLTVVFVKKHFQKFKELLH